MKKNMHFIALGVYLLMFVVLIFVQVAILVVNGWDPLALTDAQMIRLNSISNLTFYGLTTFLFIVLFIGYWKDQITDFFKNAKEYLVTVLVGFAGLYIVQIIFGLIFQFFNIGQSENQEQLEMLLEGSTFDLVALAAFAVLGAPIVEEVIFRFAIFKIGDLFTKNAGYKTPDVKDNPMFANFKESIWPRIIIMVVSALAFGITHIQGDYIQLLVYAGMGGLLAYIYHRTGNIIVPILTHMILNGFVTLIMFGFIG